MKKANWEIGTKIGKGEKWIEIKEVEILVDGYNSLTKAQKENTKESDWIMYNGGMTETKMEEMIKKFNLEVVK